jgi:cystathionine gamma-synthase
MQAMLGGIVDPHTAYLLLRGMKTLGVRMRKQNDNGMAIARFLEAHPRVRRVYYPGLSSHPDYKIACEQMKGFGGVVSFEIDGDLTTTSKFIDHLQIPYIAPSLGGVETLIEQPALMSFYEMASEERAAIGIADELVRLSLGIEDAEDLIADLGQALSNI